MSYSLAVYLIDLDDLRTALGSGRAELQELSTKFRDITENEKTLSEALRDVVYGTCRAGAHAYLYGIALQCLAERLGERLDTPLFETTHGVYLDEVRDVLPLVERGTPVLLPSWRSFPRVGFLTREECRNHAKVSLDHPNQEVRAGRAAFSEWIEAAASENKDLLGFWA